MTKQELQTLRDRLVAIQEHLSIAAKSITDVIHEEILPRLASSTTTEVSSLASNGGNTGVSTFKPATKPKGDPLVELQHNLNKLGGKDLAYAIKKLNEELGE